MADDYDDLIAAQRGFQVGEYYGICLHQVGGLYLAISSFFTVGLPLQTRAGQNPNGLCLFRLAFSHDGMHFRHPAGRPAFLELGQPGEFDAGFATSMSNLVEHGDDQLFYYSGGRYAHGWCINPNFSMRRDIALEDQRRMYTMGLARIKRDRFASLSATYKGRVDVEIGPRQGERLLINARCPRGWVRFALAEQRSPLHVEPPKGESLPGFSFDECVPFAGDAVRHAVQFKNASVGSIPADKSLILRLEIAAGDVYAYEWAEDRR